MVLTLVGVIRLSLGPARMTEDLYPLRQILEWLLELEEIRLRSRRVIAQLPYPSFVPTALLYCLPRCCS